MCCTRYVPPDVAAAERFWHIGRRNGWRGQPQGDLFPSYAGFFIRPALGGPKASAAREVVGGQWNLIPDFAPARAVTFATHNARFEEVTGKKSFKESWARGQRCIIPALAFYEPCWETRRHVPWRFERPDGRPWGLAGLWNAWTDPVTGEIIESYTMLTVNADHHPLMRRMHKPDPKLPPDRQDKRAAVPIESHDVDLWLHGHAHEAGRLMTLPPPEAYVGIPEETPREGPQQGDLFDDF